MALPVIAEIVRSGFVEGHHYGSVLALDSDGEQLYARGEVDAQLLPRSCNKPIQLLGMLGAGLDLPADLLALSCASHSGESFHLDGVRRILDLAGLEESALQCPADLPLAQDIRDDLLRAGGVASPILMNCSGKHAAMLLTCVRNGWPVETYLAADHPLQQVIAETFAELTGEPIEQVAVDGCGAPLLSTSLTGLARGFARLATARQGPAHLIAQAIRQHPEYVSGSTREECTLLRAIPGAIGKAGAEACHVLALADGRAFALKADDGGIRARRVVMAALLTRLGVDVEPGVDTAAVRATGESPLLGGARVVGQIRAVL